MERLELVKLFISPHFSGKDTAQGGIRRVYEAQQKYFPDLDIDIIDHLSKADLAAVHATEWVDHDVVVAHNHGLYWAGYDWPAWAIKANQKLVEIIKKAKITTTPSQWVANSMRRGMLIDPVVLPHGVEPDEWQPPKTKEPYILWAKTRPDPICNPDDMNRLAAKATGIKFVSTFGKPADNITLIGALPLPEIKPYIENAAIYLATPRETGAITVLEAMSCGTVPLGWNWGANSEIVEHKVTGYLATPGDYDDLFEGLIYCRNNWKELSANARQAVIDKFQWKDQIVKYREVYDLALQQPAPGPAVSIIITAYNLESYLPTCIESVLSQDFTDFELIIVDDASPDNCGRIADEYAERDRRIRVIHNNSNAYLAEARNIAVRSSHGRYIMPLDADDQLGAGALRTLAGYLDRTPETDIATGSMELIEEDGRRWVSGWPTASPNYNEQINYHNQVPYASMYRRWVWERTGGYRRRMKTAEDAEFWTRAMSYGAVPAKVTNTPTLIYSNRSSSMSHKEPAVRWDAWFPWAKYQDMTPYAASGIPPKEDLFWSINSYGPVEVSVVIPCGPGHDWYLQDALDSLAAQTFLNWECIVVNDTGKPWYDGDKLINPYLQGFPWAKIIDSDGTNHGVAWARTTGTVAAKAPLVFYLDADDFLQPAALDVFVAAYKAYGGWIYSDWYDQQGEVKHAQDWSAEGLTVKMLGPMTGLYPRDAMLATMFEDFGGWEDWDVQLSLLERGICGTHVAHPLFTYRYHTGTRREDNFEKAENLLQYIHTKHSRLYKEGEFLQMCKKCGSGGGRSRVAAHSGVGRSSNKASAPAGAEDMALVEYVGQMTQFQTLKSRVHPGHQYYYGGNPGDDSRKFYAYKADLPRLLNSNDFQIAPPPAAVGPVVDDLPVLDAFTRPAPVVRFDDFFAEQAAPKEEVPVAAATIDVQENVLVSQLKLAPETISILEAAGFDTAEQLKPLSVAQLVTIKGIGATRAAKIVEAVTEALG